jgi:hypothetical protein
MNVLIDLAGVSMAATITRALAVVPWIFRIPLSAFFVFVGYWKAFGPIEALADHHAWVAGLPDWFARAVGWSEILCATGLLLPSKFDERRIVLFAAVILVVNQVIALAVHVARGEGNVAAPQNIVLLLLLAIVIALELRKARVAPR